jgi:uncharacterized protein (TIGR00730 family)
MADKQDKTPIVCVFCGSSAGNNPIHIESARVLANSLADANYKLVYGGGTMGIMGEVSSTFVKRLGPKSVHGIIPNALIRTEKDGTLRNGEAHSAAKAPKVERTLTSDELKSIQTTSDGLSANDIVPESEYGSTTIVPDMHTRKRMMAANVGAGGPGSGFVALAGGYGTMEEVMEMVTWNQLAIHDIPIVLVNINGYYDGVIDWIRTGIREGFIGEDNANILVEVKRAEDAVEALNTYEVAKGRFKLQWGN